MCDATDPFVMTPTAATARRSTTQVARDDGDEAPAGTAAFPARFAAAFWRQPTDGEPTEGLTGEIKEDRHRKRRVWRA